jgi:selenocysteine lyase/cysteine desulfurase
MSHGIDDGFFNRFVWDGTRDYAAALAVPVVLDYWERVGVENTRRQIKETLTQAVALLSEMWHDGIDEDGTITLAPMHLHSPMALVRLPTRITALEGEATSDDAKHIQDYLYHNRIEVPIKCIQGRLFVRLSCHVYNTLADYKRLGQVMLQYRV